jgi:hypothetical protein
VAVPFVCFPRWILLVFFGFLSQVIWPFLLACLPACLPSFLLLGKFSSLLVSQFANPPLSTSSSAPPRRSFFCFLRGSASWELEAIIILEAAGRQAEICGLWFFVGRKKRRRLSRRRKECETLTNTTSTALERFLRILVLFHRL